MKYVIVRDDDINYFTKPEWLELLYTPFFEKGIPVSFSVIPYIRTDSVNLNEDNIYHQKTGIKYEPFIQPEFRGRSESFSVNQNQSLIDFMSTHKNNIEILQHGYAHERIKGEKEFRISDIKKLEFRLKKGREIIEKAFNVIPEFFSPPWDSVSAEALSLIKKNYKGISLERYHHSILPVHLWWRFFKKKQKDFPNAKFFQSKGFYRITSDTFHKKSDAVKEKKSLKNQGVPSWVMKY